MNDILKKTAIAAEGGEAARQIVDQYIRTGISMVHNHVQSFSQQPAGTDAGDHLIPK